MLAPSAITDTMAPMCGKNACGVIVVAENVTMIVRVIQLIGAAFPDDTTSPTVAFTLPWTEKPKATREERGLKPLEPKEGADGHSQ